MTANTSFSDGIWFLRASTLTVSDCRLSVRGREDRGEKNDVRPVIEIPFVKFSPLRERARSAA